MENLTSSKIRRKFPFPLEIYMYNAINFLLYADAKNLKNVPFGGYLNRVKNFRLDFYNFEDKN